MPTAKFKGRAAREACDPPLVSVGVDAPGVVCEAQQHGLNIGTGLPVPHRTWLFSVSYEPHIERSCASAWYEDRRLGLSETVRTSAATVHHQQAR
jgi:hypothetical protein